MVGGSERLMLCARWATTAEEKFTDDWDAEVGKWEGCGQECLWRLCFIADEVDCYRVNLRRFPWVRMLAGMGFKGGRR